MRYHSEHLKLYFKGKKNTVLQRGDLQDKSEKKTVHSVQISFSSENDTFDF